MRVKSGEWNWIMDEQMKLAYEQRHKQAFRIAFDALKEVWPPENTVEYFEKTNERLKDIYMEHRDNPLCKQLVLGVARYLGHAAKELEAIELEVRN